MALRLTKITLREIRLTLREPFQISSGLTTDRRILLLELEDGDGHSAWSECVAGERPHFSAETIDTAWLAVKEWIAPRVLRQGVAHPSGLDERLRSGIRGHHMARAAVEMGGWALWATRERTSLARLLGGTRDAIATGISIGIQDTPDALVKTAQAALAAGYRKVKIKIRPGADLEYVAAVREALGPDAPLMADANCAYTLRHSDHLADLDPFRLMMIEQPLAYDDLRRHAQLQDLIATPICLDESITSVERAEDMLTLGSGRIITIKAGRVGGFAQAKAIHDLCRLERRAGLVRGDAGEWRRSSVQRGARVPPTLHAAGRREPQLPLLEPGYHHARVDHGCRGNGRGAGGSTGYRRGGRPRPSGQPDGSVRNRRYRVNRPVVLT